VYPSGQPQPTNPWPGYSAAPPAPVKARPPVGALPPPVAVHWVPSTAYGVAIVPVSTTVSGQAVASLVAGVGAILVSFVVLLFGVVGGSKGWGPQVAGAFALLATVVGVAAVVLSRIGARRVRVAGGEVTGRGMATAGMVCGAVGLGLTVVGMLLSVSLTISGGGTAG
jgi:hypothetical protein